MAAWYRETLEHAGVRAEILAEWTPSEILRTHVLLLCGRGTLNSAQAHAVTAWVEAGGCLVVSGGTWGLETLLGLKPDSAVHRSVGYARPLGEDRLWPDHAPRAKFFGGTTVGIATAQPIAEVGGNPIVTRARHGKGLTIFVGFHLGQTFNQMVLGRSVEVDGIGSADGTAALDDGILRAEDGHVLDFDDDRATVEGSDVPFFGEAHADIVRDVWSHAIWNAIDASGQSAPCLWYWPNSANAVAMLTCDTQDFEVDRVINLQRMLQMFGCQATWMVAMPGYAADVYRALRAMEHEVGLLFQIEDNTKGWHEERLKIQLTNLSRLASWPYMSTVRIEDGQWRGWQQFYDFCEAAGARVSLNKMGRQPGTSGFLFGTCHPFFPVKRDGKESLVCEIPGQLWAPGIQAPEQVGAAMVERVDQRSGLLQIAMRPESIADGAASMSLRRILALCKERRVQFVKPDEISRFERSRRQMRMIQKHVGDTDLIQLASETEALGLTVMINGETRVARDRHGDLGAFQVKRFGTTFSAVNIDVPARMLTDIEWMPAALVAKRRSVI